MSNLPVRGTGPLQLPPDLLPTATPAPPTSATPATATPSKPATELTPSDQLNQTTASSSAATHVSFAENLSIPDAIHASPAEPPRSSAISDQQFEQALNSFQNTSKQEMEKEFRFAPAGSDKWKLFKGMELLAKIETEIDSIKDPEAKQVLVMRRAEIVDLVDHLKQQPEIEAAFGRVQERAMEQSGISPEDLLAQAQYLTSDDFREQLKALPLTEQPQFLQNELAKVQFFNPDQARQIAGSMGAQALVNEGLSQLGHLNPEGRQQVRENIDSLLGDLLDSPAGDLNQAKGLQSLFRKLKPEQALLLRETLADFSMNIENMDADGLVNAIREIEGLDPQLQQDLLQLDWHGELHQVLSSVAAVGSLIRLGRSVEGLKASGMTLRNGINMVKTTTSLIGSSKDAAGTAAWLSKRAGADNLSTRLSSLSKSLGGLSVVKWAGPISGAISGLDELYSMGQEIQNEDTAGAWFKGISAGAALVGAAAGGVAAWYGAGATATAIAGPIGLAAVAIGLGASAGYALLAESAETGEFRKELRDLGISDQEDALEADFQDHFRVRGSNNELEINSTASLEWALSKPVPEQARLINALLDQTTDQDEENFIYSLLQQAEGRNADSNGQDDFDRIMERISPRRLASELDDAPVEALLSSLRSRSGPAAQAAEESFAVGLVDGHRLDLLKQTNGKPLASVQEYSAATLKDMAQAVMKGITTGQEEIFLAGIVVNQPIDKLAEILGRGDQQLIKDLVSELRKTDTTRLLQRFVEIDSRLTELQAELANGPANTALEQEQKTLKNALAVPLNHLVQELANESNNALFTSYQDVLNSTLQPAITKHLSPETLEQVVGKLSSSSLWSTQESTQALVRVLQQASPEQFSYLLDANTDTFIRQVPANLSTTQASALLDRFVDGQSAPNHHFQRFAFGLIEAGHKDILKTFLASRPQLDLSQTPALQVLRQDPSLENLNALKRNRQALANLDNPQKALIISELMEGWTTDGTESVIHRLLTDTHAQNPDDFKALASMIDSYKLANELGDFWQDGQGNAESLEVFELLARDGRPEDFESYATRLGADDNVNVLFAFSSKASNQRQIAKLPARALQEMSESMMKGYTGNRAEQAISNLLVHSSDAAFTEMLADQDFSSWISKELETNEAAWFSTLTGDADPLQTMMSRLGRLATQLEQIEKQPGPQTTAQNHLLALKPKIIEASNSFGLAISQRDYGQILARTANSEATEATMRLLNPPVLKAMLEEIMAGYTGEASEDAISDILQKTSPSQLRKLLDSEVGGKKFVDQLSSELDSDHLRALMKKLIGEDSVQTGMGFSYLASSLAERHEGSTLRDLIGQDPAVIRQLHPTVLQNMAMSLTKGWTSDASQTAIADILKHASPQQLELLLQSSDRSQPQQVSDYLAGQLSDSQLQAALANFDQSNPPGPGQRAFLSSLSQRPDMVAAIPAQRIRQLNPASLQHLTQEALSAWGAATFSGNERAALQHLLDQSSQKQLQAQLEGVNGHLLGRAIDDNSARNQQLLKAILANGDTTQFTAYTEQTAVSTLQSAWTGLKADQVALPAAARETLFKHFAAAGDSGRALEMLQGVSGIRKMGSLAGTRTGGRMLDTLSQQISHFDRQGAAKLATWTLAHGSQRQIDNTMLSLRNDFYFGNGGAVVKAVIAEAEAQNLDIRGKLKLSTLRSMVGALDNTWTKLFGDYDSNVRYVGKLAELVDSQGKAAIIGDLMSGWTPGEAESLIHQIFRDTTSPREFTQLLDRVGPQRLSNELEDRGELGKVMAYTLERYQQQYSSQSRNDDSIVRSMMGQWSSTSIKSDDVIWQMLKQLEHDGQLSQLRALRNSTLDEMIDWTDDAFRDGNVFSLDAESEWSVRHLDGAKR